MPHARTDIHEQGQESGCAVWIPLKNCTKQHQPRFVGGGPCAHKSGQSRRNYTGERLPVLNQEEVVIDYKGTVFKEKLKYDWLADGCLLVELKAVQDVLPIHKAQLLSYMKLLNVPLGLLFNFHDVKLVDGISRLVLPGANKP